MDSRLSLVTVSLCYLNGEVSSPYILVDESRHVIELFLETHFLSDLSSEIGQIPYLTRLVLTFPNNTALSEELGNTEKLEELYLSTNNIEILPDSLCKLSLLECLVISDNQLSVLPACIGELQSLQFLDFYNTRVKSLPASFFKLDLDNLYLPKHLCGYSREQLYTVTRGLHPHSDNP